MKKKINPFSRQENLISVLKSDLIVPLEIIRTSCELLLRGITGKLLPEQMDFIKKISDQSEKSLSLIHDLVDMGKMDTGFELNFVNLRIRDILEHITPSFKKMLKGKRLKLLVPENYPNFPFLGDIAGIEQVCNNLLALCIRESLEGSTVRIDIQPLHGQRRSDHNRLFYKVSFTYQGPQVSEDQMKFLFDDNTRNIKKPHYMRIPASRHVMLLHKGSITLENLHTGEIQYSMIIPSSIEVVKEYSKASRDILILGENAEDNQIVASALSDFNIPTISETSPEKAFNIINAKQIRLVIFDFEPSAENFNLFLKEFDSHETCREIPLIVYCKKENQKSLASFERYFSDILTKPVDEVELQARLENYLLSPVASIENVMKDMKMILVAGDDPNFRKQFKEFLAGDFSVIGCKNGPEALFFMKKFNFSCAIFDAEMPGMDGIELITKVRKFDTTTPVIFCTDQHTEIYQRGASIFGVARVLRRPFKKEELIKTINEVYRT